jgi:hypothetical protein
MEISHRWNASGHLVWSIRLHYTIDDLRTIKDTYKFVDDVTLTEVITSHADSQMQLALNQVQPHGHK